MSASNYLENKVLDHVLGTAAFTWPAASYLALFTADPGEAGPGTEVAGLGYARQVVPFSVASNGAAENPSLITFPAATGGAWGTITHFAIFDAVTGGNMLLYGRFEKESPPGTLVPDPRTIVDTDQMAINAGALDVTAD